MIFKSIAKSLNIHHGESARTLLLFFIFFLTAFGGCLGLSTCETLFINLYGVENVPYVFLFTSIYTIAVTLLLSAVESKFSFPVFASFLFLLLAGAIFFVSTAITTSPYPYLFTALLFVLTYSTFFIIKSYIIKIVEYVTDQRQFKRLFPVISSGATLGLAIGGFSTGAIIALLGKKLYLMYVWNFLLVAAIALLIILVKTTSSMHNGIPEIKKIAPNPFAGFSNLGQSKLYLYIALFVFIFSFMVMHFDYIYFYAVRKISILPEHINDPDYMARTFGMVRGFSTIITFILQFFLSPILIRVLGLTNVLFIFPISFLLSFGFVSLKFSQLSAFTGRFGYYITKEGFHVPAFQPLYNALSEKIKGGAVVFVNNVAGSFGGMFANLFLLYVVSGKILAVSKSAYIGVGLAAILILLVFKIKKQYVIELLSNIKENSPKQLDMLATVRKLGEADTFNYMKSILQGEDKELIIFTLESLKNFSQKIDSNTLIDLIERVRDSEVFLKVVEYFKNDYNEALLIKIDSLKLTLDQKGKIAVIEYLQRCSGGEPKGYSNMVTWLADTDPIVAVRAASYLIALENPAVSDYAKLIIEETLANASKEVFLVIMLQLSKISHLSMGKIVFKYFSKFEPLEPTHKEISFSKYLRYLIYFQDLEIFKQVIDFSIHHPGYRHEIISALKSMPLNQFFVEHIREKCKEENTKQRREYLLRLLSCYPASDLDTQTLFFEQLCSEQQSVMVNLHIVKSLISGTSNNVESIFCSDNVDKLEQLFKKQYKLMERERELAWSFKEKDKKFNGIVFDELLSQISLRYSYVEALILFIYKEKGIDVAMNGITSKNLKIKNASLETLENVLPRKTFEHLLFIFENGTTKWFQDRHADVHQHTDSEVIDALLGSGSLWQNMLGVHVATELRVTEFKERVSLYEHTDPIWVETANSYRFLP